MNLSYLFTINYIYTIATYNQTRVRRRLVQLLTDYFDVGKSRGGYHVDRTHIPDISTCRRSRLSYLAAEGR